MRRYQNRNRDMIAGYPSEPTSFKPPQMPSQLDPKDERLLELSAEVGNLQGQNDLLAEDNGRLEQENAELREKNNDLRERNTSLERQDSAGIDAYSEATKIIESVEKQLKDRKK